MAQLRDAQTSEIIAEGTPEQVVLLADELGQDNVLYDGVGLAFDPDAVRQVSAENLEGLRGAASELATSVNARPTDAEGKARKSREQEQLASITGNVEQLEQGAQRARDAAEQAAAIIESAQDPDRDTLPHVDLAA